MRASSLVLCSDGARNFRDCTVRDVVEHVPRRLGIATAWHLREPLAERSYSTQYDETDLQLVRRLFPSSQFVLAKTRTFVDHVIENAGDLESRPKGGASQIVPL